MSLVPLIIDVEVPYADSTTSPSSLLMLPLGPWSVLEHLLSRLGSATEGPWLVMPGFPSCRAYEEGLRASTSAKVRVVEGNELAALLGNYEPSDHLLAIEPRNWPLKGYDVDALLGGGSEYRGVTHVVTIGADVDGARELVECDGEGGVQRVRRLYNLVVWPEIASRAITCSLIPMGVMSRVSFRTLTDLRCLLSSRGVLSRDVPFLSECADLTDEEEFLGFQERVLAELVSQTPPAGFSVRGRQILVGGRCEIDPSARLVPPMILQSGVTIEAGATVVGPALVGAGSRVGEGATVVQSVVGTAAVVPAGTKVRHRFVWGTWSAARSQEAPPVRLDCGSRVSNGGRDRDEAKLASAVVSRLERRRIHLMVKRIMDVLLSALALVALSPLLAVVAVLIKIGSRGPVFFIHHRERRGGREFPCLKFRTMVQGAHHQQRVLYAHNEVDGPQFKLRYDPRVTRLGRWLRATNIDELPQLINVLFGHMSLVGPRPSPFRENQICVPWRRARLSIRPGLTGLWQLCRRGERGEGDFNEWIHFDIAYVQQFSIWLDIKIMLGTLWVLVVGRSVPPSWLVREGGGHGNYPLQTSLG